MVCNSNSVWFPGTTFVLIVVAGSNHRNTGVALGKHSRSNDTAQLAPKKFQKVPKYYPNDKAWATGLYRAAKKFVVVGYNIINFDSWLDVAISALSEMSTSGRADPDISGWTDELRFHFSTSMT